MFESGGTGHNERPDTDRPGGFQMFTRNKRSTRARCEHRDVVTVLNAGIERTVCETCGRVSFEAHESLTGGAERSQFERDIDHQPVG